MDDFFSKKRQQEAMSDFGAVLKPFVGCPTRLSVAKRQELIYRYQYLEESTHTLASEYRLTPKATEDYFKENNISPILLETPEDFAKFEEHVKEVYKNIRVRLSGLVAIQNAIAWDTLAVSEGHLLASLENATRLCQERSEYAVDAKELKQLVDAHAKVIDRQQVIRNAIDVPAKADIEELTDTLARTLEELLDEIDGESRKLPKDQQGPDAADDS